jgi:hypothetical protein
MELEHYTLHHENHHSLSVIMDSWLLTVDHVSTEICIQIGQSIYKYTHALHICSLSCCHVCAKCKLQTTKLHIFRDGIYII